MALQSTCGLSELIGSDGVENKDALNIGEILFPIKPEATKMQGVPCLSHCYSNSFITAGFIYQGGIVLAVDMRRTADDSTKSAERIVNIRENVMAAGVGIAAVYEQWSRKLKVKCQMHLNKAGKPLSVNGICYYLAKAIRESAPHGQMYNFSMLVAGFDGDNPVLCMIDSSGSKLSEQILATGDGANTALCVIKSGYRYEMTEGEAYKLAFRAVVQSAVFDSRTGGNVLMHNLTKDGWGLASFNAHMNFQD